MDFEWDAGKAASNRRKHGVDFDEATTIFGDPLAATFDDPGAYQGERRYLTFGYSSSNRALLVVHTDRGDKIRIISAREMTRQEKRNYES